ncbi:MAG TPA: helix-turn-helix transcriptional regulator [Terracidiphilus sp.]|jgi:PadR family transcriptional regulator PadR
MSSKEKRTAQLLQGTLYPARVRLEQCGWIKGGWGKIQNYREAKFYTVSRNGRKAPAGETTRWRTMSDLVERLLVEGTRA